MSDDQSKTLLRYIGPNSTVHVAKGKDVEARALTTGTVYPSKGNAALPRDSRQVVNMIETGLLVSVKEPKAEAQSEEKSEADDKSPAKKSN